MGVGVGKVRGPRVRVSAICSVPVRRVSFVVVRVELVFGLLVVLVVEVVVSESRISSDLSE